MLISSPTIDWKIDESQEYIVVAKSHQGACTKDYRIGLDQRGDDGFDRCLCKLGVNEQLMPGLGCILQAKNASRMESLMGKEPAKNVETETVQGLSGFRGEQSSCTNIRESVIFRKCHLDAFCLASSLSSRERRYAAGRHRPHQAQRSHFW